MKLTILIRKDLKMPIGKAISQACHASVEAVLRSSKYKVEAWHRKGMKKVILKVMGKEELLKYKKMAEKNKLVTALITDAGKTFFKGKSTITCLAIGPDEENKIDKITKDLKIL